MSSKSRESPRSNGSANQKPNYDSNPSEGEAHQMDMIDYDHSPTQQTRFDPTGDQFKWKEVLRFMKTNPKIMLELMPPTPGKRRAEKDIEAIEQLVNSTAKKSLPENFNDNNQKLQTQ